MLSSKRVTKRHAHLFGVFRSGSVPDAGHAGGAEAGLRSASTCGRFRWSRLRTRCQRRNLHTTKTMRILGRFRRSCGDALRLV
jgi:hypothetical protein